METLEPTPEELKRSYGIHAIRYQVEFGEFADDIVRMVTQYIAEGWLDWGQGLMMLKNIFYPDMIDDGKEILK